MASQTLENTNQKNQWKPECRKHCHVQQKRIPRNVEETLQALGKAQPGHPASAFKSKRLCPKEETSRQSCCSASKYY